MIFLSFLKYNKINNLNLINELYRREFYYYISFYDNSFTKKNNNLDLENDLERLMKEPENDYNWIIEIKHINQ